ncbi:MAG TPA: sensor histidine kinase [Acidimicrobiales bacterium]|nr:sensor histidine kinase [Acidimicrobiales bacterium]
MDDRTTSVRREGLRFAIPGVLALVILLAASLWVARSIARTEATRDAEATAELLATTVIEPNLDDGVVAGDPDALARLDALVRRRVLVDPTVTARIWSADGTVVYSDKAELIGDTYELDEDDLADLRGGGTDAGVSDLSKPENRFERGYGELLEVYTGVQSTSGEPFLFEIYQRQSSVESDATRIFRSVVPVVVGSLVLLMAVQLTLAWRMARRLERAQAEREELYQQALDASDAERRRIAADLHDGVVQDLAGVGFTLAALADRAGDDTSGTEFGAGDARAAARLASSAGTVRRSVRALRSLLVEIYPPNLAEAGLDTALADLVASTNGWSAVDVAVDPGLELTVGQKTVIYRVAREALQNVRKHAGADRVTVSVEPTGEDGAVLTVTDDGRGFDPGGASAGDRAVGGHVGLRLMGDAAERAHGALSVTSAPGSGTTVRLEVPAS